MPILNGFDACKRIQSILDDNKTQLFNTSSLSKITDKVGTFNEETNGEVTELDVINSLKEENKPLIIAYADVLDEDVIKKCQSYGFDLWLEEPLNIDNIQSMIIPLVEYRNQVRQQKYVIQKQTLLQDSMKALSQKKVTSQRVISQANLGKLKVGSLTPQKMQESSSKADWQLPR